MKRLFLIVAALLCAVLALAQASPVVDSLSADGPYIIYTRDGVRVVSADCKGRIRDTLMSRAPETFMVADHAGRYPFQVKLRPLCYQKWEQRSEASRTFVMSDPHGRLDCVISLLQGNEVIDSTLHWSYGKDRLVMIGDIFDRGDDAVQIFWFFYKLQQEAAEAGGSVIMMLGNHEPMELAGDMRYATRKYKRLERKLGVEYRSLFGSDSELGQWISTWNVIGIVGRDLFVHAGLGGEFYRRDIPIWEVNASMRSALFKLSKERRAVSDEMQFLYGSDGPIWYRGLVMDEPKRNPIQGDTLNLLLKRYEVDHIIVGHTMMDDVRTFHDGRVICVNVNNPENMASGAGRALLITPGGYYIAGDRGVLRKIE